MSNENNYINSLTQTIHLGKRRKSIFNLTFLFAFIGPMISTIILFAISVAGIERPPSWVNWVLFLVFVPLIFTSLVMIQKKELVGAYGETILILIPTFVWLLPSHYESMMWLLVISAIIVLLGGLSYLIGIFIRTKNQYKNIEKRKKATNILLRIAFVASSVVSTVAVSVILINWGDVSLDLAVNEIGQRDYTVTAWIMFVAIVTIATALLLIILGLVSNHTYKVLKSNRNKGKNSSFKTSKSSFINHTIISNVKKDRWYKKLFRKKRGL